MKIVKAGSEQSAAQVNGYFQCFPKSEHNRGKAVPLFLNHQRRGIPL